ncbi:alginate lyase family protein [Xanthomonas nasturtii]|uniref:alginate lyase family protein n=1 Tax=Xanthomonas nasturtii TaxID=1843581 RepID=UPI002011811C|nr:alginate lyase family protein [Xanthomonas nasturtii]MCL1501368.1 alginate lyase family protein [Xanthomonas nasturtii]MCL1505242.1 alginate lyase family protein [Xanthomonas nasturtii]MCL1524765.1 alginate lyase family protein [Xanthomonas nasturtii]
MVAASARFERASSATDAATALACVGQGLDRWADAGALLDPDASKTGIAERKWALAAIAAVVMRTQALSNHRFELSQASRTWLAQLAQQVIADHTPRRKASFAHFNNHDYWAAWAIAATGMAIGQQDDIDWADVALRRALTE